MILYFFTGRHSWDRRSRSQRANSCNISSPDQCQSLDHMLAPTCDLGREAKETWQRKMCRPLLCQIFLNMCRICRPSASLQWKKSNVSLRRRTDKIGKLLVSIDDHNHRHKFQSRVHWIYKCVATHCMHNAHSLVRFIISQSVQPAGADARESGESSFGALLTMKERLSRFWNLTPHFSQN